MSSRVAVALMLAGLSVGLGCKKDGAGPRGDIFGDAGDVDGPPSAFEDAAVTPDGAGGTSDQCALMLQGGQTASYACQAMSTVGLSGSWQLRIAPTDNPGNTSISVSVEMAGTAVPPPGSYTFDSPAVDAASAIGLTVLGAPVQTWNARKGDAGDGGTPRVGSLALQLTAVGPPHGTLSATLVAEPTGRPDVTLTATF